MKIKPAIFFLMLISPFSLHARPADQKPLSERITGYGIDVKLDAEAKTVSGTMEAFWVNNTSDTVPDIRMHLYMNAFRNSSSTFYRESGGSPGSRDMDPGWIEINSFITDDGTDLLPVMDFISPDDGNLDDKTVIRVMLPRPALPGDTVAVMIDFETKLPSNIRRTGFTGDFYFVAQWFPKFGVYEAAREGETGRGAWNCHQFHAHSEFYSNHSVYDVKITLPADHLTGSCGKLISEKVDGELKTQVFRAEDIVDFAWTAWPGYTVHKDKWNHIEITLLVPEARTEQVERHFTAVKNALEYFTDNVGPYPWTYMTIVDPPLSGSGASGMEYTTLFTSQSSDVMPEFINIPEMVTIHEFGHAYFMGILASNEFEEPWLDEGVNTYWETRIMDHYYGSNSGMVDHRHFKVSDKSVARLSYVMSPARQIATNREYSWNYPRGSYSMLSYQKAATVLHTLAGVIGEETMNNAFREYYSKWAFRHPTGRDFINVVSEVVRKEHGGKFGHDMNWFFDQTLYGNGICDYRVSQIDNRKYRKPEGRMDYTDEPEDEDSGTDSLYTAVAMIDRVGEVMLPVEVLIHFNNGDEVLEVWDGRERYKDFTYTGYRQIEWVKIDPEYKIAMDVNMVNNSMSESPSRTPVRRITNKLLAFFQFYFSLMLL
ncbi:MAG: M1 family metallopeptidase [Bacteroidales bacterium]|nr:M1 family metallopeptidase [Bacteroidales bacterium]